VPPAEKPWGTRYTRMMNMLQSTKKITEKAQYLASSDEFFGKFHLGFDAVRGQILKLETKQFYDEVGNASFDAFRSGDLKKAIALISESKQAEVDDYEHLRSNHIDFVRCRPVVKPLSDYLKWEFLNYDINQEFGERIYLINMIQAQDLFENFALHDFMVFDCRFAYVHDYDDEGRLRGGWFTDDTESIVALLNLFGLIKANSVSYSSVYPNGFR
jgi:hypothetical protein